MANALSRGGQWREPPRSQTFFLMVAQRDGSEIAWRTAKIDQLTFEMASS